MITVQLSAGDFTATLQVDEHPHPDLLDELTVRCQRMFLDTQAELPDDAAEDVEDVE